MVIEMFVTDVGNGGGGKMTTPVAMLVKCVAGDFANNMGNSSFETV